MHDPRRVASIDDLGGQPVGDAGATLRQPQQHHAAIGTEAATIEGGGDLLALNGWQRERQQAIVVHGGCGSVRIGKRLASTTKSLCCFRPLSYIRQRIPAMLMNRPG